MGQGDCVLKLNPTDDPKAQKAIGLYEKALEPSVNPRCWQAHLKLALIYYDVWREGEGYRKALRHFEQAAAIRTSSEWKRGARQAYDEIRKGE